MKRLKSLIRKDRSLRATNDPGYDVVPSDFSTFRTPSELAKAESQKVERKKPEERPSWETSSANWDNIYSLPRTQDNPPSNVFEIQPRQGEAKTYLKTDVNPSSESILLPPLPTQNSHNSREHYAPFSSVGSHTSAGNARIPDEDLLEPTSDTETKQWFENTTSHSAAVAQSEIKDEKRRRRRESHNAIERRRRDIINESIRTLAFLAPGGTDRDRPKQAILEKAISWTRDLMWALHLKTQRESTLKDAIQDLGGTPFMVDAVDSLDNIEESIIEKEVQIALETNNITSFSSADKAPRHKRRASEPLKEHSIYHRKPHDQPTPRRLHKVTSRGSIISYVASVHSVTSMTYRSPTGDIQTETREENSNFSYFSEQLKQDQSMQDSNDSKYTPDFLTPNIFAKETPMPERTMRPLATNVGFKDSNGGNSPASQTGIDPHISGKVKENVIRSTKEDETRKQDSVAQDGSKVDDGGSFSGSVAAVNLENADKDPDARSLARHSDQGASDTKTQNFAVDNTELIELLKNSDAGIDQDDRSHGGQDSNDVQHANCSAVYLDNGLVRLRWTCVGNVRIFSEADVLT